MKTGVFDSGSNKKYNDAISNYDQEDGIDIVKCNSECLNCRYRDIALDRCLFETCVKKLYPVSVPFHTKFTIRCKLCNAKIEMSFEDGQHPFTDIPSICKVCIIKLKDLLNGVNL